MLLHTVMILLLVGCTPAITDIYIVTDGNNTQMDEGELAVNSIEEGIRTVVRLRQEGNQNPIALHIMAGEHRLSAPIKIGPEMGPLKLIGEGAEKTLIKGSKIIDTKWERYNGQIKVAQLDRNADFDQLYVNGKRQILARYPNYDEKGGHWQGHAADAIAPERVKTWSDPVGAIVHAMHSGEWGGFHYVATGVDGNGELILDKGHQNNRPSPMHKKYRMVENVLEELDSSEEWFLDTAHKLYYWPAPGTDIANAVVEGVHLKHLLEIVGTEENPVKDIQVSGIGFQHTRRTILEEYEPLLRSDWMIYRGGAVFLEGVENVCIEDCELADLGGNAIFVSNYNRDVVIKGNHIHDCGASGISFVGSPEAVRSPSFQYNEFVPLSEMDTIKGPKSNKYPSNSQAIDNLIYRIGRVEKQTAGVEIAMAMHITVGHNSIYEVPRAGINIGDGTWGGHILEYNDVFATVLESGDHGAFNSWGRDRFWHPDRDTMDQIAAANPEMPNWDAIHTTIIRNNRFRCDHGWDIDLDDGSSNYHIYDNLCLNGGIKLREGFNRIAENNITINNGFHPHVWFKNSGDVFRHNIVFTEHKDIGLQDWGREVDYNLFPDKETLRLSRDKGVDANSVYGDALFVDARSGDFRVEEGSPAFAIGFRNFDMDGFGVQNDHLKSLARTPDIPTLFFGNTNGGSETYNWLGAEIKSIVSMAERSAAGLDKTAGVLILAIDQQGIVGNSSLRPGDVIIECEGNEILTVADLMKCYQNYNWHGKLDLTIFRNQNRHSISMSTK